jgi:hypothetical protein
LSLFGATFAAPIPGCFGCLERHSSFGESTSSSSYRGTVMEALDSRYRSKTALRTYNKELSPLMQKAKMSFNTAASLQSNVLQNGHDLLSRGIKPKNALSASRPGSLKATGSYRDEVKQTDKRNEELEGISKQLEMAIHKMEDGGMYNEAQPMTDLKRKIDEYLYSLAIHPHDSLQEFDERIISMGPDHAEVRKAMNDLLQQKKAVDRVLNEGLAIHDGRDM